MKKITELKFEVVAEIFHKAFAAYGHGSVWDISFTSCGEIYIHLGGNEKVFKYTDNPVVKIHEGFVRLTSTEGEEFRLLVLTPTEFVSNNPIIKRAIEAQK
jgi:hypothetical protein